MITLFFLAPVLVVAVVIHLVVRLVFGGLWWSSWHRRRYYGGSPYFGGYGRGYYPRHRFGGLGLILFLAAIDRFFDRHF